MVKRLDTTPLTANALEKKEKKENKVKNLMNSSLQPFYITPVQVLMVSLFFIGTVFLLHLYARFSPGTFSQQMIVASVVLTISLFVAYKINEKL